MHYDGCLFLPEYNLLIDTPLDGVVEVHGLGAMNSNTHAAVWHSVVPVEVAVECDAKKIKACGLGKNIHSHHCLIEMEVPSLLGPDKQKLQVELICVHQISMFDQSRKAGFLTLEEIKCSTLLREKKKDADVQIVYGVPMVETQPIQSKKHTLCGHPKNCLLYTSPSPRDLSTSRMPSSA